MRIPTDHLVLEALAEAGPGAAIGDVYAAYGGLVLERYLGRVQPVGFRAFQSAVERLEAEGRLRAELVPIGRGGARRRHLSPVPTTSATWTTWTTTSSPPWSP